MNFNLTADQIALVALFVSFAAAIVSGYSAYQAKKSVGAIQTSNDLVLRKEWLDAYLALVETERHFRQPTGKRSDDARRGYCNPLDVDDQLLEALRTVNGLAKFWKNQGVHIALKKVFALNAELNASVEDSLDEYGSPVNVAFAKDCNAKIKAEIDGAIAIVTNQLLRNAL